MKRVEILRNLNNNKKLEVKHLSKNNYYFGEKRVEFSSKDLSWTKNIFTFKELYELLKR